MNFVKTAVDIQKCIEAHKTEKVITKFCLLCQHFHVNLCLRADCKVCKFAEYVRFLFWDNSSAEQKISFFHRHCTLHQTEFYSLHCLLMSLATEKREKKPTRSAKKFIIT